MRSAAAAPLPPLLLRGLCVTRPQTYTLNCHVQYTGPWWIVKGSRNEIERHGNRMWKDSLFKRENRSCCWTWCLVPSIFRWLWGDKGFSNTAFMSLLSCTLWMKNQQYLETVLAPFPLCSQDQNILQQCNFQLTYPEAKWKQKREINGPGNFEENNSTILGWTRTREM